MWLSLKKFFRLTWFSNTTKRLESNRRMLDEVLWAQIYHDTIAGREDLRGLSLSPGRWAANYSLLYLIVRVLLAVRPKRILELGLGESSKVISTLLNSELPDSRHIVVEHDDQWISFFTTNFTLSSRSEIFRCNLIESKSDGIAPRRYADFQKCLKDGFDFYLIDGPFGSEPFSREELIQIVDSLQEGHSFVIIMDDYNRTGERKTVELALERLRARGVSFKSTVYSGVKDQFVLVSPENKFIISL